MKNTKVYITENFKSDVKNGRIKKNMIKRILSMMMVVMMLISMLPTMAFADEESTLYYVDGVQLEGEALEDYLAQLNGTSTEEDSLDVVETPAQEDGVDETDFIPETDLDPTPSENDGIATVNSIDMNQMSVGGVEYLNPIIDGNTVSFETKEAVDPTYITENTTSLTSGWYVVDSTVTISSRITVTDDVHLILSDNTTLTASAGITVEGDNSLTIYAQSTGSSMGELVATAASDSAHNSGTDAGIGGTAGNSAGTITINGGNIEATGGDILAWYAGTGAGLGGGGSSSGTSGAGGIITINGGTVIATGGTNTNSVGSYVGYYIGSGAGIGGGGSYSGTAGAGGTITINGGIIEATGGPIKDGDNSGSGAGIGGGGTRSGTAGVGGTVTINDGTVTASGGEGVWTGAGIGSGGRSKVDTISVSGIVTVSTTVGYGTSASSIADIAAYTLGIGAEMEDFSTDQYAKVQAMDLNWSITTQPTDGTYTYGENTIISSLSVAVTGNTNDIKYQWYSCTSTGGSASVIEGATSATYQPTVSDAGTYYYYCAVSNTSGSDTVIVNSKIATVTISPIQLTWNSGTVSDKVYDGNNTATVVTAPTLNGVLSGDTAPTFTVGTATFASENVGANQAITATGYSVADDTNYLAPTDQPAFDVASITAKELTVTPESGLWKYYGEADSAFTYTYTGEIDDETPSFTGSLTREDGENVGTYAISQGSLNVGDTNYYVTFVNTVTYEITQANSSVVIADIADITYGKEVIIEATVAGVNGEIPTGTVQFKLGDDDLGEAIEVDATGTATYIIVNPSAGDYTVTATFTSTNTNYYSSETATATTFAVNVSETTTVADPSTDDTTTNVTVTISADTSSTEATVNVESVYLKDAVEAAIEEATKTDTTPKVTLEIDTPSTAISLEVVLDSTILMDLADTEGGEFVIKTSVGMLTFDNTALNAILEQADGQEITIGMCKIEDVASELTAEQLVVVGDALVFELYIECNGERITDFDGGTVTVHVLEELQLEDGETLLVYYIAADGSIEEMEAVYNSEDRTITFVTTHFSHYVIQVVDPTENETTDNDAVDTGDISNSFMYVLLLIVSVYANIAIVIVKKKKNKVIY